MLRNVHVVSSYIFILYSSYSPEIYYFELVIQIEMSLRVLTFL